MKENEQNISAQSIPEREEVVLRRWKKESIFESTLKQTESGEPYVFYDGPPFATGVPHYGHILAGTIKDIIPRYQTMRGRYVRREWGWDCHGLPIENLIEKELGFKQKKDIEEYGVKEFNQKARESVMQYDHEWKSVVPRMGRFVDMEKSYKTMDADYTESIWWAFATLYGKKLIYEGYKSMHICPRCETTLAISEVGMNYKDIKDISVYVKFELVDEPGTYLLAWTTTPWTLPGNVAVAVHPDLDYALVAFEGKNYWLAEGRVKKVFDGKTYEIAKKTKGKELIGRVYVPLFDHYAKDLTLENHENGWKVVGADFVTTEDGTGIVHEAPAFGEEDMELGRKLKLPMVQHVAMDGTIKPEVVEFAGMQVKPKDDHTRTDVEVIKFLAGKGMLFAKEKIEHSYPHCWRCDTPLLNYASSSWFVDVTALKSRLVSENGDVMWVPQSVGTGRFGNWLSGARDWAISRSRYWGAPLPVWKCNKCGKVEVIQSLEQLRSRTTSGNSFQVMRHGEAETNTKGIVSYKLEDEYHLTQKGKQQVEDAATLLKDSGIDLIVASPILRTKETAEIVAKGLGLPPDALTYDERLMEVNTGEFNGCSIEKYRTYFVSTMEKFEKPTPGGETLQEMKNRLGACLFDINKKYQGKKILLITHEYSTWLLDALARGLTQEETAWIREKGDEDYVKNAEVIALPFAPFPHNDRYELDFHRPYIDDVVYHCSCELGTMSRIPEVFDCWFESGAMPFASVHYMGDDTTPEGKLFRANFPADFIAEGLDQTRGWFYSLMVLSLGLFDQSPFKSVIVNGLILAEDGQKMSKKLKNYPDPMELVAKYGADALRLYMIGSPVVRGEDLRFSERGVEEVFKKVILRLDNVRTFYELFAKNAVISRSTPTSKNVLDQWIIARVNEVHAEVTQALDIHELDRAVRPLFPLFDDLSTWYIRRSRDRFKGSDTQDAECALETTGWVLFQITKLLAPFAPFIADDLYQRLSVTEKKNSVHAEGWEESLPVDTHALELMRITREYVSVGLEQRAKAGIKVRQPLARFGVKTLAGITPAHGAIIADELNVKLVAEDPSQQEDFLLDTILTPELRDEGMIRDLTRYIQELRKTKGFAQGDPAMLRVRGDARGKALVDSGASVFKTIAHITRIVVDDTIEAEPAMDEPLIILTIEPIL